MRNGARFRELSTKNDVLTFIVYDHRGLVLLTKSTGLGIDQADDGSYLITVPATEMNNQTFPGEQYRYVVRIVEGDTGERYLLNHGPLYLRSFPL